MWSFSKIFAEQSNLFTIKPIGSMAGISENVCRTIEYFITEPTGSVGELSAKMSADYPLHGLNEQTLKDTALLKTIVYQLEKHVNNHVY